MKMEKEVGVVKRMFQLWADAKRYNEMVKKCNRMDGVEERLAIVERERDDVKQKLDLKTKELEQVKRDSGPGHHAGPPPPSTPIQYSGGSSEIPEGFNNDK